MCHFQILAADVEPQPHKQCPTRRYPSRSPLDSIWKHHQRTKLRVISKWASFELIRIAKFFIAVTMAMVLEGWQA